MLEQNGSELVIPTTLDLTRLQHRAYGYPPLCVTLSNLLPVERLGRLDRATREHVHASVPLVRDNQLQQFPVHIREFRDGWPLLRLGRQHGISDQHQSDQRSQWEPPHNRPPFASYWPFFRTRLLLLLSA